jgi:hypothetical protein
VPQWNGTSGALLSAGLPVGTTGNSTIVETNSSGQIASSLVPTLNQSTTGNAATATALASTPSVCSSGYAPTGVDAHGNAQGCTALNTALNTLVVGSGTGAFTISMKDATVNEDTFPVVTYRGNTANTNTAFDIIPNGTPSEVTDVGIAWNDICDADILNLDGSQVTTCLHLGAGASNIYIGSIAYGIGATLKPLVFEVGAMHDSTFPVPAMQIMPSTAQIGIGGTVGMATAPYTSGGQLDIMKDSNVATEAAGLTIGTPYGAGDPELLLGTDHTHSLAYLQSAARGSSFTSQPLTLNPEGGVVNLGTSSNPGSLRMAGAVTVSTLPACASGTLGRVQEVSDATSATPGTPAAGSGTYTIRVQCIFNGSGSVYSWIID